MFTPRETQVLSAIIQYSDNTTKHIARRLGMREGTVKVHLSHIYLKLGVHNKAAVVARLLGLRHRLNITGQAGDLTALPAPQRRLRFERRGSFLPSNRPVALNGPHKGPPIELSN